MDKIKMLRSIDYEHNEETDISDEDLYLLENPEEHPKATETAKANFLRITGVKHEAVKMKDTLKNLVKDKKIEKFIVKYGYKNETVWRLLEIPKKVVKKKEIKTKLF